MDALALLCTLHADGPQTLKRLRSSGCDSLQVLESFDPAALARMLDVAPAVARRLAREARLLAQRVDLEVGMEREEAPYFEAPAAVAAGPAQATFGAQAESASPAATHDGAAVHGDQLERRDREILDKVMDRWREADARTPGTPEPDPATTENAAVDEADLGDPVLQADDLDGLRASDVDGLARAGVETLQELVDCDCLTAASSAGMPFASVKRLQLLARRQLGVEQATAAAHGDAAEKPAAEPPAAARVDPPEVPVVASEAAFSPAEDDVLVAEAPAEHETGTVLDWNFEIPLPPTSAPAGYDDPSGPFA